MRWGYELRLPSLAGMSSPWLAARLKPQSAVSNAVYDVFFKRSSTYMATVMVVATTAGIGYDYAMNAIWDKLNKGVRRAPEARATAARQMQLPRILPSGRARALCDTRRAARAATQPAPALRPLSSQRAAASSRLPALGGIACPPHSLTLRPPPAPSVRRSSGRTSRTCPATTNSQSAALAHRPGARACPAPQVLRCGRSCTRAGVEPLVTRRAVARVFGR